MIAPLHGRALKDSRLVGETTGRIRQLSGFQKGFREPQEITKATREFVARLGAADAMARAEKLFKELRAAFGYKRKELRLMLADRVAAIGTPDFDVNFWVEQDADKVDGYRLVTEVAAFRTPAIIHDDRFQGLFGRFCDRVVMEFTQPFRIEDQIDAIENLPALAPHLDYDAQGLWFTLTLPSPAIKIHVIQNRLTLALSGPGNLKLLVDHSLAALAVLRGDQMAPALP